MMLDKFQYLLGDTGVGTDAAAIHLPVAQLFRLCILGWHDANGHYLPWFLTRWRSRAETCARAAPLSLDHLVGAGEHIFGDLTPSASLRQGQTNKCLAQSNKSRTAAKATNEPGRPWLSNLSTYRLPFGDGAPPPTSASSPEPSNESISDNIMVMFPNKGWSRR